MNGFVLLFSLPTFLIFLREIMLLLESALQFSKLDAIWAHMEVIGRFKLDVNLLKIKYQGLILAASSMVSLQALSTFRSSFIR